MNFGKETISIPCYDHIILGDDLQAALREKDRLDWGEDWGWSDEDKGVPISALVNKFVELENVEEKNIRPDANYRRTIQAIYTTQTAKRLVQTMKVMHRVGILNRDINSTNIAQGKFIAFSCT
ncbi:hypothetical protein BKA67DRAFT_664046 [Truncatella angustata]|uniref:Uncharacterized protein n=1 Tax=Truncatella angustata TaxID=152316 RepID=A0A9P8RMZ0_9PEZI|nr:uncharacterized protein BKA67DRAFT_664046 [Truncatella angustata]KAH6646195.1 hypothetical protein BKA67DRAFT_664046 [Truncatella angustata]